MKILLIIIVISVLVYLFYKFYKPLKEKIKLRSNEFYKKNNRGKIYIIEPYIFNFKSDEQKFSMLLNRYREDEGSGHLICDKRTVNESLKRAESFKDTNRKDFTSHTGIGEMNIQMFTFGADSISELLGYGYNSAEGFFKSLKNSEKHNKAILNKDMDWFGLGICKNKDNRNVWCLILGNEETIK